MQLASLYNLFHQVELIRLSRSFIILLTFITLE